MTAFAGLGPRPDSLPRPCLPSPPEARPRQDPLEQTPSPTTTVTTRPPGQRSIPLIPPLLPTSTDTTKTNSPRPLRPFYLHPTFLLLTFRWKTPLFQSSPLLFPLDPSTSSEPLKFLASLPTRLLVGDTRIVTCFSEVKNSILRMLSGSPTIKIEVKRLLLWL